MRLISTLSDALARGAVALACDEQHTALPCWCWIALGSEGRQKQVFVFDQDNGIIFGDNSDPDAQRALLLPLARCIIGLLANCGFPLCPGAIMDSNAACCLSLQEWRAIRRMDSRGRPLLPAERGHLL